ncbi:hypothetical protein PNH38_09530 [Anoxybacillus rupiensis]|jgi:hypothetical protein|uniref:Lipoprotein n=1 Tax=Anoxybacteroides rupiense TaxID=311460 RepID=A0ABT5W480_9BACL|nr:MULTISPECIES: hypothetical protein [Anoxybacillus]MDE8564128.1 hypothetical protein [Anoxybacillus rupiensis]QHC04028.1 hypothetical protein GRQ40_08645 [Anoxybacillus sp. PDR2]
MNKKGNLWIITLLAATMLTSCSGDQEKQQKQNQSTDSTGGGMHSSNHGQ